MLVFSGCCPQQFPQTLIANCLLISRSLLRRNPPVWYISQCDIPHILLPPLFLEEIHVHVPLSGSYLCQIMDKRLHRDKRNVDYSIIIQRPIPFSGYRFIISNYPILLYHLSFSSICPKWRAILLTSCPPKDYTYPSCFICSL